MEPIVFALPGYDIDTKLQVFDAEFHVHSVILKLHSKFFRIFLDSPDKTPPTSARLRYEYDTVVDQDGKSWGLEVALKVKERGEEKVKFQGWEGSSFGSSEKEAAGFKRMLASFYNEPFELPTVYHFQDLARIADFYGALPAVSRALDGAFFRSPSLLDSMRYWPVEYLILARKLRHKALYKEIMVLAAAQWRSLNQTTMLDDYPEVRVRAIITNAGILDKLDLANRELLRITKAAKGPDSRPWHPVILNRLQCHAASMPSDQLPQYYRMLYEDKFEITENDVKAPFSKVSQSSLQSWSREAATTVRGILEPLMKNNLTLDKSKDSPGRGRFSSYFLCAEISDEDLPWDVKEKVW